MVSPLVLEGARTWLGKHEVSLLLLFAMAPSASRSFAEVVAGAKIEPDGEAKVVAGSGDGEVEARIQQLLAELRGLQGIKEKMGQSSNKRSFDDSETRGVPNTAAGDKTFKSLIKHLPSSVEVKNAMTVAIPRTLIKKQLMNLASSSLVFGFMGRVPSKAELTNWLSGPQMLNQRGTVEFVQYLSKGFFTVSFNDSQMVSKVLQRSPCFFNRSPVCVLPWDPAFELSDTFKELCPVWVEFPCGCGRI